MNKDRIKKILTLTATCFVLLCTQAVCNFRKYINQGNNLFNKQKYEEAIEKYNSAEIKKPDSAIVYYNRGNALYKQQLYEQAVKDYQKSLGLTKDKELKSKILFNMGNTYLKLGDVENAKQSYISALKLNPTDEDIKYNLQYALVELKDQKQKRTQQNQLSNQNTQQKQQQKKEQQEKKYMSEQDVQRLIETVGRQQKEQLKEALKPQRPQLPPVDKDW